MRFDSMPVTSIATQARLNPLRLKYVTLQRFCGFANFTAEFSPLTVFVGPNNGGKTTILRAVQFALEAFRLCFGDSHQPTLHKLKEPDQNHWLADLEPAASRAGITDLSYVFYQLDRNSASSVLLALDVDGFDVQVKATCRETKNNVHVSCQVGGDSIQKKTEAEARSIVNKLYQARPEFYPPPTTLTPNENVLEWEQLQKELQR